MSFLIIPLTSLLLTVEGARILAVVPGAARSHHIVIQAVLRTLAEAGHDVTVYGAHSLHDPPANYTDVTLGNERINYTASKNWNCLENIFSRYNTLMDRTFGNKDIAALLESDEKFDLIITEPYHGQEFNLIFGHKFQAPTIGIHTYSANSLVNLHMGNVFSAPHIPQMCYPHSENMSMWERFLNTMALIGGIYSYYVYHLPNVERKMKELFPDMPALQDLTNNVSLVFVNEHQTMDYAQPRPLTIVPVAGIHIEPVKHLPQDDFMTSQSQNRLPKDIQEFMDDATAGVILLALGSVIPDETKPAKYFTGISNTFRKLPQRVIWKTRREKIENLPDNVMLVKWMPQREVLAHPRCVLFITHGGAASYYEAILSGVPVVGIPHFADQHRNVAFYVAKEVGVRILPDDISEASLSMAIQTVLGDTKYRDNMRSLSRIFLDTPMSPRQAVVYWTDYILRHRGASYLKPALAGLPWYQRTLLDIGAVVVGVVTATVVLLYIIVRGARHLYNSFQIHIALWSKKLN